MCTQHAAQFSTLTTQEMRLLLLVCEGLTNRQIAGEHYLGEGTIRNYVSIVLTNRAVAIAAIVLIIRGKLR